MHGTKSQSNSAFMACQLGSEHEWRDSDESHEQAHFLAASRRCVDATPDVDFFAGIADFLADVMSSLERVVRL